jgi:hypothetical protein
MSAARRLGDSTYHSFAASEKRRPTQLDSTCAREPLGPRARRVAVRARALYE